MLQGLPPILPDGPIRALILGSFPSVQSLERQQYYAHSQNWFWRVMQHCGVVDDAGAPYSERVAQVRSSRIAIWDLYEQVRREGSGDDKIRDAVSNPIGELLESRGPFPILLNGRRLREFRRAFPDLEAELIVLPSTSPRPLHWNTEVSRSAAIEEWCAALSINAESG
ncbi:MAG: DNA-deoxyinosine glycosylase [Chloroflexi bacterium]|nr:DNA-deoxyinosine glycosylase [Chloroflexota bacterium]MCY3695532.1 DNA-deoxyinosine glycosylase [Chloroflexota bacterium]